MASTTPTATAATSFYDLCDADKADLAYWAIDRACAGEPPQADDGAALLFALGLVNRAAQALRVALPKGGAV
ncbi:hypothetical protein HNP33_003499 [Comamonas odontotermitis]|uniref:Uncharacterized protein n=1 Tax=Comamonas odontotermitis TaxID=379895 RepID=A0ABR6RJQ1_9BURK|nr:hypothetical protein [Comamonas odontotermitis]